MFKNHIINNQNEKEYKKVILADNIIEVIFNNQHILQVIRSTQSKKVISKVTIVYLTNETFKQMVFNYDKNKEWKYEGTKPAIIDFYAYWCPPCRQLSPLVEEIAQEYSGKIVVYKVDTDKEKILAQSLGISGLPTLLFIP